MLNYIVNVNFFSDLKIEYYYDYDTEIPLNDLKIEYYYDYYTEIPLNKKLKVMEEIMKYFVNKLLGHEIFRSMVSWAAKFLLKNL